MSAALQLRSVLRRGLHLVRLGLTLFALQSAAAFAQSYEREVPLTATPPKIDGHIDEAAWEKAALIEDFRQFEPIESGPPTEATRLRLLVDKDNLYIAIECFDSDPAGIRGTIVTRDAVMDADDRVEILVDTFFDRRNAYWFQIGPAGGNGDALVEDNGGRFIKEWDGIWEGRALRTETGWTAEIALPAKTLGMAAVHERFGFNARRYIKRKNEILEWAHPVRTRSIYQVAHAGTLSGLSPLDPGLGIDFMPYTTLTQRRDPETDSNAFDAEVGFDLRYRLNAALQATLTVNTDFAEAEVDERVVNLTRFPVFFPERRDFFLQDAGIFGFGGLRQSPIPFFSRRIGLSAQGQKVPLLAGLKVTGREDDVSFGALATWMDATDSVDQKLLGVARVKWNVLEQSQVGLITTFGDPGTNGDNGVLGADFQYRTDSFLGNRTLTVDGFFQMSLDNSANPAAAQNVLGYSYGINARYPNDIVNAQLSLWEIGSDFRPDLGFVRRGGTRQLTANYQYRPRPGKDSKIRNYLFAVDTNLFYAIDEEEIESFNPVITPFGILFESGDRFDLRYEPDFERLFEPFNIAENVSIGRGDYHFHRGVLRLEASDKRPVAGVLEMSYGSFFTGTRWTASGSLALRLMTGLNVETRFDINDIELDEGHFTTRLATLRIGVDFDPDISWTTFAQWDDVSDTIGINSRFRWILEPGDDLFLVVQQGLVTADDRDRLRFRTGPTEINLKVGLTFRF